MNPLSFFRWAVPFLALALPLGCARAKVARLPDGVVRITCEKGMKTCVMRAEKICEDKGYVIVGGQARTRLLGGASSSYRQLSEVAELELVCGDVAPADNRKPVFSIGGQRSEPAVAVDPTPELRAPSACVPGATQACVGSGACAGGQVCLSDGSGFGPCDCGSAATSGGSSAAPDAPPGTTPSAPPKGEAPERPAVPNAAPEPTPLSSGSSSGSGVVSGGSAPSAAPAPTGPSAPGAPKKN